MLATGSDSARPDGAVKI